MTAFEEIYDLALVDINDYKLNKLAVEDISSFSLHLEGLLIRAIPKFKGCLTSLEYETVDGAPYFTEDLDIQEKSILADLMVIEWFTSKIQDVTQFQGSLSTREFKKFSEANNLKVKSEYKNRLIENVEQAITDYQVSHLEDTIEF